ncbi:hypothetical protein NNJEOMEG_00313 [Fundidesulfovibrio magnetotacticus]|uniref:Nitroreductase domain-containing protein n=1 Tax=Fundidesulfovibrio magnetotacticus TaxID=2730080 RepID=A0A6V8LQ80_9BACT|nr:nitroreductase family protein [Fundidesulfovibrio magnetotacticus]GFK92488.1 hypothetical protein NNJEOMEG_00313 [Fundidesulfovibrio magnetotacticus]
MVTQARRYHEAVSYMRGLLSGGGPDWSDQPRQFKSYPGLPLVELPREAELPGVSVAQSVQGASGAAAAPAGLDVLSAVLFHAAGLTRSASHGGVEHIYRACPSAGALYPCEVYLAWPGGGGLRSGLHHYDVTRHGLTPLRPGGVDPEALGLPGRSRLPGEALFLVTAVMHRSAWKYRARAYRYLNLDAGHLAEGLALGLGAYRIPWRMELDFSDEAVAAHLGLDPAREACLCVARFEAGGQAEADAAPGPLPEGVEAFSRCAVSDGLAQDLAAVHRAASLTHDHVSPESGKDRALPGGAATRLGSGLRWRALPDGAGAAGRATFFEAVESRCSRRAFMPVELSPAVAAQALSTLCGALLPPGGHPLEHACEAGVLLGSGPWGGPGLYMLDREGVALGLRRDGDMRPAMASVCLDQLWMRRAAMVALFFADFDALDPLLGARGVRWSFQAAGRLGQRLYLAAESLGLGACGVGAFYDGEAAELLGLPEGTSLLYAVPMGPVKSSRR